MIYIITGIILLILFSISAPDMDSVQRQALISAKINDLRKEYLLVKSRITVVDRRRKKIKKRKKELIKLSAIDKTNVTG